MMRGPPEDYDPFDGLVAAIVNSYIVELYRGIRVSWRCGIPCIRLQDRRENHLSDRVGYAITRDAIALVDRTGIHMGAGLLCTRAHGRIGVNSDTILMLGAPCHALSRQPSQFSYRGVAMLGTILLIVVVLMLLGAIPAWPYSRGWGYGPSGGLGLVLIIVVVLLLTGRL
jgi:hypothetical protein